jgi:hypothetical protein
VSDGVSRTAHVWTPAGVAFLEIEGEWPASVTTVVKYEPELQADGKTLRVALARGGGSEVLTYRMSHVEPPKA